MYEGRTRLRSESDCPLSSNAVCAWGTVEYGRATAAVVRTGVIVGSAPTESLNFPGSTMDHRVRAILDIVERDLKHPADWPALSNTVRLSPSGLRRVFTLNTGLSPSAYLTRLRFERARELLSTPDTALLRVKEIMAEVGINDPSHFAREFKRRYGLSPESFRRRSLSARAGDSTN